MIFLHRWQCLNFIFNVLRVSVPEHTTFKSRACKVLETSYCSYNRAVVLTTEMMDDIPQMLNGCFLF